jgi:predicted DCC family thiol-disulfide oxidoreductase YuxK
MVDETRVLYNETCPVCRFEINGYARRVAAEGLPLRFETLDHAQAWGISVQEAARRLHVIHQGQLLSGMAAFRALWSQMPRWRWLAKLTALPLIAPVTDFVYEHVLAALLYRAHVRREARKVKSP